MKPYELAFIVTPTVDDEGVQAVVDKVSGYVTKQQGVVNTKNVWGRRRLAYPINDYREGTYVLFEASMVPSSVVEVERDLRITDDVIRFLVFRADE